MILATTSAWVVMLVVGPAMLGEPLLAILVMLEALVGLLPPTMPLAEVVAGAVILELPTLVVVAGNFGVTKSAGDGWLWPSFPPVLPETLVSVLQGSL